MNRLKETRELVLAVFLTFAQALVSFKDGAQASDVFDFSDEALLFKPAIDGLSENFKMEMSIAKPGEIDEIFDEGHQILVDAGLKPMVAFTITSGLKTAFGGVSAAAQNGDPLTVPANLEKLKSTVATKRAA